MVEIYIDLVSGSINSAGGRGRRGGRKEGGKIQEKWVNRSKVKRPQHRDWCIYAIYVT